MIHAREDYNRIQDPLGLIPEDEPVFLIRGKDVLAPAALLSWCTFARRCGVSEEMIAVVEAWVVEIIKYQVKNGFKIPDMPSNTNL